MSRYTPRPVPRGFFDMGSRTNAYEALLSACWWVEFCGLYQGRLPVQVQHKVYDALQHIAVIWPQVDGPRSIRVGARRALRRAMRTAERMLRTLEAT